ncbi:putative peptidase a1 protein [Neofusicoccum parvum UCRNP2]|uniref:Putative peptidase a1 protein n=1 Tax=Botryosphaeria parva (strain UCR-NP2) TaxID=1287680 RepID=R1H3T1_BOTPV|nr:putative peptidase a1 protein [Neofusicoccum parvum UCRNP2]
MIIRSINETSNPTESTGGSNTLSAGAIAGAVVGGIIAGLLLAALIACIYIRRRRRQRRQRESIKPSSVAHTRSSSSATLPGGRPRAGSRIASFFRNPWGSFDADAVVPGHFELAVDPSGLTPAEEELARRQREHKRHHSNELDAEVSALHEMYQPKPERLEMQGDEPFPTYVSGDGGTVDGNALRAEHAADAEAERRKRAELAGVYEMDATGGLLLFGRGGGSGTATPTPLPSPPMPSPGQIDAVTRKEREERERLEAERAHAERIRAEELQERVGAGAVDAIEPVDGATGERPDAERRVSDLSPISENGTFARSPVSARPDSGSRRVSRD